MIANPKLENYAFLSGMYRDDYYPVLLVDRGKEILIGLCERIEESEPQTASELLALTHQATEQFNDLAGEFVERDSEIESVARDVIGMDFDYIAKAYGFDLDVEDVIAPREW